MADNTHPATNPEKNDASKEKEMPNEYITIVAKKLRTINKKLNRIANIEKNVASGTEINEEQQQLLNNKQNLVKSQAEFEKIKKQMLDIYNRASKQEEKLQKRLKRKTEAADQKDQDVNLDKLKSIVEIVQTVNFLESQREAVNAVLPLGSLKTAEDVQKVLQFGSIVKSGELDAAAAQLQKYLAASEDTAPVGTSYKSLREQVGLLYSKRTSLPEPQQKEQQQAAEVSAASTSANGTPAAEQQQPAAPEPAKAEEPAAAPAAAEEGEKSGEKPSTEGRRGGGFRRGRGGRGKPRGPPGGNGASPNGGHEGGSRRGRGGPRRGGGGKPRGAAAGGGAAAPAQQQ